ncbi:hypothetical protein [Kitasatospora sp. NPDC005856]|uniref:hypothetical protein n=1 Tax=Kitasatospora sp. NPDC005856 TaxID=3154566 RepID=UPI00340E6CDD
MQISDWIALAGTAGGLLMSLAAIFVTYHIYHLQTEEARRNGRDVETPALLAHILRLIEMILSNMPSAWNESRRNRGPDISGRQWTRPAQPRHVPPAPRPPKRSDGDSPRQRSIAQPEKDRAHAPEPAGREPTERPSYQELIEEIDRMMPSDEHGEKHDPPNRERDTPDYGIPGL